VNVVSNDKPAGIRGRCRGDVALKEILGVLDQVRRVHEVVLGVEIKVDDVVAKVGHVGLAAGLRIAIRVRRAHVGGEEAQDVVEGDLVVVHLIEALRLGNLVLSLDRRRRTEIQMAPRVRDDLVTSRVHTLDQRRPWVVGVVDLALAEIVSSDHETGNYTIGFEGVQDG